MSRFRVVIENAICGLNRFNILVHKFCNRKGNFENDVILATAGLRHLALSLSYPYSTTHLMDIVLVSGESGRVWKP